MRSRPRARARRPRRAARAPGGVDREYKLEATMLGFRGIEGAIDGIRNPTLTALTGETVRITIVNGELMVHDIALEKLGVKSAQILDRGVSTSITFVAKASDTYYCTVPGHRAAGMQGRLEVSDAPRAEPEGVLPEVNGRPLDLGFETGTLENWTVEGDAFAVVDGTAAPAATAAPRRPAMPARTGSPARPAAARAPGRSRPCRSASPSRTRAFSSRAARSPARASNWCWRSRTRSIYSISGTNHAPLRPAVVDLSAYVGKDIFVRLVDGETGAPTATYLKESPWAHINFDNFRFHESKPAFLNEVTPAETPTLPPMDRVLHAGLSGAEAARAMTVPKGFTVKLAASEPDVVRPIAFAHRRSRPPVGRRGAHLSGARGGGRGPRSHPDPRGHQRRRTPRQPQGVHREPELRQRHRGRVRRRVGRRGARTCCSSRSQEGGDTPAGPPQVMLDGWGYQDTHEMLNTFTWGPDGWLYGTHGVFTQSNVGQAGRAGRGAPAAQRRGVALPSDQARVRGVRPRHEQPVGPGLQRLRPRLHHRLRHRAPVPHRAVGAVQAAGRASISTRTPTTTSRPSPTTCTGSAARARMPATAARTRRAAAMRTPAR